MKNYSQAVRDAIAQGNARTELFELQLSTSTLFLTTAGHDIVHNSQTYIAGGQILGNGTINQEKELRVSTVEIAITAVDQTILALFQNANQQNRQITISQVVLDSSHQVIGSIYSAKFLISQYSVTESDEEAVIALSVTNAFSDFNAVNGVRTTMNSFRRLYPNSTAFINATDTGSDLKWGGK